MIKSSKVSLKFTNPAKAKQLSVFIAEYQNVVSKFVDALWDVEDMPSLLPKEITSQISTWLSARALQCVGKQASGIVRGTQKKQKQRLWMINKLTEEGRFKQARKLQRIYDATVVTKPNIVAVEPELDRRFVKIDLDNKTSFDGWLTLTSLGNKLKIVIPFKKTRHFNKLLQAGSLKRGIRLSEHNLTVMFDLPDVPKKENGTILGIDVGQTTTLSCSNGITSQKNKHGHDLSTISDKLARKRKGSKSFHRSAEHRRNYINWTINQLDLSGVKQANLEGIKNLRKGKSYSRRLSHWTYTEIFGKLESYCNEQGVLVRKVNPIYTSQRCSCCGWTSKSNRTGKVFKCARCGNICDADLNASRNIALPLIGISNQQLLKRINRTGFYWLVEGQEPIVPAVAKHFSMDCNAFQ